MTVSSIGAHLSGLSIILGTPLFEYLNKQTQEDAVRAKKWVSLHCCRSWERHINRYLCAVGSHHAKRPLAWLWYEHSMRTDGSLNLVARVTKAGKQTTQTLTVAIYFLTATRNAGFMRLHSPRNSQRHIKQLKIAKLFPLKSTKTTMESDFEHIINLTKSEEDLLWHFQIYVLLPYPCDDATQQNDACSRLF